jgi:hypothetical protein
VYQEAKSLAHKFLSMITTDIFPKLISLSLKGNHFAYAIFSLDVIGLNSFHQSSSQFTISQDLVYHQSNIHPEYKSHSTIFLSGIWTL